MPSALRKPAQPSQGELSAKIAALFDVNRRRKALEAEEAELKDYFKELAGAHDYEFTDGEHAVKVTHTARETLDRKAVTDLIGVKKVMACLKTTHAVEVRVGKAKE